MKRLQRLTTGKLLVSAVVLVVIGACLSFLDVHSLLTAFQWVSHSIEVQDDLHLLDANLSRAESAARGYALGAAEPSAFAEYRGSVLATRRTYGSLLALTADNAEQQGRLVRLKPLLDAKIAALDGLMAARARGLAAARAAYASASGRKGMQEVLSLTSDMANEEGRLLAERRASAARDFASSLSLIVFNAVMLLALLGWARRLLAERRLQAELLASREHLRVLYENISDYAIYTLDPSGVVTSWNPGAERIKGYTAEEIIGRNFSIFYSEEERAAGRPAWALEQARRHGRQEEEGWRVRKDGSRFWADAILRPYESAPGVLAGFIKVTRDISERKKADDIVRQAYEELARKNRELNEFATVAAHDLQEPLRKVLTFGDSLRAEQARLSPEGAEDLHRVLSAATRMHSLIEGLLAYSRVGSRGGRFEKTDLAAVFDEALNDLELRVRETGGKVEASGLPSLEGDPLQVRQLFQNLLANSLKFHRPGVAPQIRVSARPARPEEIAASGLAGGRRYCRISLEDNGIGFEDEYRERIFEVFRRLNKARDYEGTGIGLAICRRIVQRHGGAIDAHGRPGQGAVFTIFLPYEQPSFGEMAHAA